MSRPRFLADEDWRFEIVLAVRRMEPALAVETVVEIGWSGKTDVEVLEYANVNGLLEAVREPLPLPLPETGRGENPGLSSPSPFRGGVGVGFSDSFLLLSHDVNTLKPEAERRITDGRGVAGVLLSAQRNSTRLLAESILMIWAASEAEEWANRVVFLPL